MLGSERGIEVRGGCHIGLGVRVVAELEHLNGSYLSLHGISLRLKARIIPV